MIAAPSLRIAHAVWRSGRAGGGATLAAAAAVAAPSPDGAPPPRLVLDAITVDGQQRLAFGVRDLPRDVVEQVASTDRSPQQWRALLLGARRERAGRADPRRLPRRRRRAVAGAVLSSRARACATSPCSSRRRSRAKQPLLPISHRDRSAPISRSPIERAAPPATRVSGVHPGTSEIPENLLRFYVHFTAPMSRGDVLRWVRLEDATGESIEHAFLALGEELWDRDATRLTLLLDPGRIKSGLRPRAELGRALARGTRSRSRSMGAGRMLPAGRSAQDRAAASASSPPTWSPPIRRAGGSSRRARAGVVPCASRSASRSTLPSSSAWCGSRTKRAGR